MPKERYEDLLDYRLKQLNKSKKAQREASSFHIVTSNQSREVNKYYSFDEIPIEVREDKYNYEILKIRYEHNKGSEGSSKFAPRIVWRYGYSYYEKLIYNNLIKRGYKEARDFQHLFPIEGTDYVVDFAFIKEKLIVECEGESWHEKCKKPEENEIMNRYLTNSGWKVLRVKFSAKSVKESLISAIREIDSVLKKIRKEES